MLVALVVSMRDDVAGKIDCEIVVLQPREVTATQNGRTTSRGPTPPFLHIRITRNVEAETIRITIALLHDVA